MTFLQGESPNIVIANFSYISEALFGLKSILKLNFAKFVDFETKGKNNSRNFIRNNKSFSNPPFRRYKRYC